MGFWHPSEYWTLRREESHECSSEPLLSKLHRLHEPRLHPLQGLVLDPKAISEFVQPSGRQLLGDLLEHVLGTLFDDVGEFLIISSTCILLNYHTHAVEGIGAVARKLLHRFVSVALASVLVDAHDRAVLGHHNARAERRLAAPALRLLAEEVLPVCSPALLQGRNTLGPAAIAGMPLGKVAGQVARRSGKLLSATQFARKVNWASGIDLKTGRPIDTPMTAAVQRLLADTRLRQQAQRVQGLYAGIDGAGLAAQAGGEINTDRTAMARATRDLRYWSARRATAQLIEPTGAADEVMFGRRVTLDREDGRRQVFRIVGEDEASVLKWHEQVGTPSVVAVVLQCRDHVVGWAAAICADCDVDDRDDAFIEIGRAHV